MHNDIYIYIYTMIYIYIYNDTYIYIYILILIYPLCLDSHGMGWMTIPNISSFDRGTHVNITDIILYNITSHSIPL